MLEIIKGLVGAFGGAFVFLYLSEYWKPLREIYTDKLTDDGKQIFAELRAKKPDSSESEIEDSIPSFCPSSVLGESVTLSSLKTIPKDKALYVGAILAVGIANPHLAPFVLIFATIAYYDLKNATAPWELSVVGVLFALSAFWQDYGIMFPNGMFNYSEMLYSLAFPASVWLGCFLIAIFFGSVFIGLLDLEAFVIASLFLRTPTLIIVSFLAFTFLKIIIVRFAPSVVSKKLAEYGMTWKVTNEKISGVSGWFGKAIYAMPALPWMFFAIVVLLVSVGHADLIRIDHFLVNGGVMQGLQYYRNLLGV